MTRLALSLLGPVQVTRDGQPVVGFAYDKVRALLVYLAVEAGHAHRREVLAGLFWPDLPDHAARTNLRQVLTTLRHAIGDHTAQPPFLLITRETIQFNPACDHALDVTLFHTLLAACDSHAHRRPTTCASCARRRLEAVRLYRGDFLAQFFLPDSAGFEEWATLKRERLHQQAIGALACLTAYYERRGAYEEAQRYARRQVELEPWNEEAHQQLMRTLWLCGQHSAALAQFERCRQMLQQEVGVEPAPEMTALYERIRDAARSAPAGQSTSMAGARLAHNLPAPTTPFIGREAELAQLADLLQHPTCRLITLMGPGGIGKTRLALQAASDESSTFAHGVCFVSLAPLTSVDLLVPAIVASLNLVLDGRSDPNERLFSYLRDKETLIVLDSFEHLLEGAGLLSELLQRAPGVSVLVTSRERLRLQGEWVVDVAGLPYPEHVQIAGLEEYSAAELFLQRARQVRGDFALTVDETPWVARICQLVGGMPLGIELAAAWVRTLSCQEIAHEIERSLDFLGGSLRDLPDRHRSLRAVLDHSWKVLAPEEGSALRWLSVFRGGCTRDAAEQVAGASPQLLVALMDRSLLRKTRAGRYDLHELVRQYAGEKLLEEGEEEALRRHAAYFLELVEQAEPSLWGGPDQRAWLKHLEEEHDNLRAALQRALDHGDVDFALRLCGAVWRFWLMRGHPAEGRRWLERGLTTAAPVPTVVRARALLGAAQLVFYQGDHPRAKVLFEQSVALFRELGPSRDFAYALAVLGWAAVFQAAVDQARASLEESLAMARELGCAYVVATALGGLGSLAWNHESDYPRARALFEESLALHREVRDPWATNIILGNLGPLVREHGDYRWATALAEEHLALARETRDAQAVASSLLQLGSIALAEGNYGRARMLVEESVTLFCEQGSTASIATALFVLGDVAYVQGDYVAARELHEQCLRIEQQLDDNVLIGRSLFWLGRMARARGDPVQAAALLEESLAVRSGTAEKWYMAWVLCSLGYVALARTDYGEAAARLKDSLALGREVGEDASIAWALVGLGQVAHAHGDHAQAKACWEESLALWRESGYRIDMDWSLVDLGEAARELGDKRGLAAWLVGLAGVRGAERAARLLGAAQAVRKSIGAQLEPSEDTRHQNFVASARAQLSQATWEAAWAEGRAMTLEQAIAYALETGDPAG